MNKILLIAFILLQQNLYSQEVDKIYLKNKEVVSGKILVVTSENIEIDPVGSKPFLIIKRKDVNIIIYSDNTIVTIDGSKTLESNKSTESNKNEMNSNILVDKRDGQEYEVGKIGEQIWMLENINFKTLNSLYKDDVYRNKYGLLYTFNEALEVCPEGWKLPSKSDFQRLINYLGGKKQAKFALQGTDGWAKSKGTNTSGFNILPGGMGQETNSGGEEYGQIGNMGYYWISDGTDLGSTLFGSQNMAQSIDFSKNHLMFYNHQKIFALSCRCVKEDSW